jgi:hypothetical protein
MSDNAFASLPGDDELFNVAGRLGELHRAVQRAGSWDQTFAHLVADAVLGTPSRDLTLEERQQVLGEVRDSLNRVIDGLGLWPDRYPPQPEVLKASDRTPRRQVWEAALRDLVGDGLFVQWPEPLQEHIVTAAVERESAAIAEQLKEHYEGVRDTLPTWEWDPEQLAAYHDEGYLEPANEPDIDACIEEARAEVAPVLAHTQVRAVAAWIDEQLQTLTERGWTVDHVQNYEQADLSWHLDPEQRHLALHTPPHAHLKEAHRHFTAEEAAAYPLLARALANAVAATAPSPAQTAFPAQALAASNSPADFALAAAPEFEAEATGPQR